jgi:hypothetical protein
MGISQKDVDKDGKDWITKYRKAMDENPLRPSRGARIKGAWRSAQRALASGMKRVFGIGGKRSHQPASLSILIDESSDVAVNAATSQKGSSVLHAVPRQRVRRKRELKKKTG